MRKLLHFTILRRRLLFLSIDIISLTIKLLSQKAVIRLLVTYTMDNSVAEKVGGMFFLGGKGRNRTQFSLSYVSPPDMANPVHFDMIHEGECHVSAVLNWFVDTAGQGTLYPFEQ